MLPVDLDPQGNLSDYFDVDPDAAPTIGEVLAGQARAVDAIHNGMIPANLGLAEAELVLSGKMGRELTLKRALRESRRQHELILIDCPPALGLLTVNALVSATHALVSAEGEYFSLQGVEQVLEVMELARENLNEGLDWLGVVLNMADMRMVHTRETLDSMRESFGEKVFRNVIRRSVRYPESAERGVSILDYRPELGADYINLADELLATARRGRGARAPARVAPGERRDASGPGRTGLLTPMAGRYDVRDKVVLVTGASRGIGADAARRLAKRGAKVSLVGLEPELLEQVAAEIGADAAWFEADVTDWDALGRAVDATVERFGGIDVVIANAGIAPFGTVATIDPDAFERTIEVNLLGRVAHRADRVAARRRAPGIHPLHRFPCGRAAPADARALRRDQGGRRGVLRQPPGRDRPHRHPRRRGVLQLHRHRHGARRPRQSVGKRAS